MATENELRLLITARDQASAAIRQARDSLESMRTQQSRHNVDLAHAGQRVREAAVAYTNASRSLAAYRQQLREQATASGGNYAVMARNSTQMRHLLADMRMARGELSNAKQVYVSLKGDQIQNAERLQEQAARTRQFRQAYSDANSTVSATRRTLTESARATGTVLRNMRQDFAALFATVGGGGSVLAGFRMGSMLAGLSMSALGVAAVGVGMALNSTKEQAQIAFTVILGSASAATAMIAGLQTVARSLPFAFNDILGAGQRLSAAGFGNPAGLIAAISDSLSAAGNTDAGALAQITEGFAQMGQTGVFSMNVINSMMSQGIPIMRALASHFHMSEFAVTQFLSRLSGRIPAGAMLDQITQAMTEAFGGTSQAEMSTFGTGLVKLQDSFKALMSTITGGVFDTAEKGLGGMADMIQGLTGMLDKLDPTVKSVAGWALLLVSVTSGMGSLGGLLGNAMPEGFAAIGKAMGGGGQSGQVGIMLAIVLAIIALIAVVTPWEAIFKAIRDGVSGDHVVGGILSLVGVDLSKTPPWFQDMVNGADFKISMSFKGAGIVWDWVTRAVADLTRSVTIALGGAGIVWNWIIQAVADLSRSVTLAFTGAGMIWNWISGAIKWLDALLNIKVISGEILWGWLQSGTELVRTLVVNFWSGAWSTLLGFLNSGTSALLRVVSLTFTGPYLTLLDWLNNVSANFSKYILLAFDWVSSGARDAWNWLVDLGKNFAKSIVLAWDWAASWMQDTWTWLVTLGKNFSKSIVLAFGWVDAAAVNVWSWLVDAGKNFAKFIMLGFEMVDKATQAIWNWLVSAAALAKTVSLDFILTSKASDIWNFLFNAVPLVPVALSFIPAVAETAKKVFNWLFGTNYAASTAGQGSGMSYPSSGGGSSAGLGGATLPMSYGGGGGSSITINVTNNGVLAGNDVQDWLVAQINQAWRQGRIEVPA